MEWTEEERNLSSYELFRRLRRQVYWAENDIARDLKIASERFEKERVEEWQRKELVLYNWLEAEGSHGMRLVRDERMVDKLQDDLPNPMLPLKGPVPWYRNIFPEDNQQTGKDKIGRWVERVGDHENAPEGAATG